MHLTCSSLVMTPTIGRRQSLRCTEKLHQWVSKSHGKYPYIIHVSTFFNTILTSIRYRGKYCVPLVYLSISILYYPHLDIL